MPSNNRVFSRDVNHLWDDLHASLTFALGPEPTADTQFVASSILDEMTGFDSSQQCLDSIRTRLGPRVFGHVTMFHMYAGTSLSGVSSYATSVRTLLQNGLTLRDLAWPHRSSRSSSMSTPSRMPRSNSVSKKPSPHGRPRWPSNLWARPWISRLRRTRHGWHRRSRRS